MNWMTSAKKRVYKTKKQRDQQKRMAALYKISEGEGTRSDYQRSHRGIRETSLGEAIHYSPNISTAQSVDLKFLRNLYREKQQEAPALMSKSFLSRADDDYDPMDDLVNSPLYTDNELTHDVDSVFRSVEKEEEAKDFEISSVKSRQSILYINNDQADNISTSEFHFDSDIQYPFPVDRSQEMPTRKQALVTEETVATEERKKKVTPSTDSNAISLIPRSWELFEGKGIQNLCQDLNIKSKEGKKKNNDSLNIDIDDSFEVDDFL